MNTINPGTLTIFTYAEFAPVCKKREDGLVWGGDVSFLQQFAQHLGLTPAIKVVDRFQDIWLAPGNCECDIAGAGIAPTAERESAGTVWSDGYFYVQRSFLIHKKNADVIHTIADFKGRKVAVTEGSTADTDLLKRNPDATPVYGLSQEEAIAALLNGGIDSFGEGDVSNEYLAAKHPDLVVVAKHYLIDGDPKSEPFSFPVREASGIVGNLNEWLKSKTLDDYRAGAKEPSRA